MGKALATGIAILGIVAVAVYVLWSDGLTEQAASSARSSGVAAFAPPMLPAAQPPGAGMALQATDDIVVAPPREARVRDVIAALKKDADAGVTQAVCRIGSELARCLQVKEVLGTRDVQLLALSRMPKSAEVERERLNIERDYAVPAKFGEACVGVDNATLATGWRYLLRAAQAGSVPAMTDFAINPPLAHNNVSSDLDGWNAHRQFAPLFLQRAIDGGNVRALYASFLHAKSGTDPYGPADPARAIVYGTAALPLVDPRSQGFIRHEMPRLEAQVGEAQGRRARVEGEELRQRSFAHAEVTDVRFNEARPMDCHEPR